MDSWTSRSTKMEHWRLSRKLMHWNSTSPLFGSHLSVLVLPWLSTQPHVILDYARKNALWFLEAESYIECPRLQTHDITRMKLIEYRDYVSCLYDEVHDVCNHFLFAMIATEAIYGTVNCSNFNLRMKATLEFSYLVVGKLGLGCSRDFLWA